MMKKITIRLTKEQFIKLNAYQHHLIRLGSEITTKQDIFITMLERLLEDTDDNYFQLGEV
jgi:glycine betaine/choline ABC-type transport system substrate-binding protein